jgi:hypothetical protein
MKRMLNILYNFFESMGQARAAAYLARQGKIIESKALYSK